MVPILLDGNSTDKIPEKMNTGGAVGVPACKLVQNTYIFTKVKRSIDDISTIIPGYWGIGGINQV